MTDDSAASYVFLVTAWLYRAGGVPLQCLPCSPLPLSISRPRKRVGRSSWWGQSALVATKTPPGRRPRRSRFKPLPIEAPASERKLGLCRFGGEAQLEEHSATNREDAGSTPVAPTLPMTVGRFFEITNMDGQRGDPNSPHAPEAQLDEYLASNQRVVSSSLTGCIWWMKPKWSRRLTVNQVVSEFESRLSPLWSSGAIA